MPPIKRSQTADPVRNFKFKVLVDGFSSTGFEKVSGLKETSEVIEYREGTDPITPRKLMGLVKYENIVLEKGVMNVTDFVDWRQDVVNILQSGNLAPDTGIPDDSVRRGMKVDVVDMHGAYGWEWDVYNAWPTELETPELNAEGNAALIDKCVIAHEGFTRSLVQAGAGSSFI